MAPSTPRIPGPTSPRPSGRLLVTLALCLAAGCPAPAQGSYVHLATPPMGWNSYNFFHCNITERIMRSMADSLVSSGLARAGYKYLNIDDCWSLKARDARGQLQADPKAFPSGIKALANYVHAKGLKLGIYADAGTQTCLYRAGSLGHEAKDAKTFSDWGIDYLKYDNCYPGPLRQLPFDRYTAMGNALAATERPIVFSMCQWGLYYPALWASSLTHANLWRTTQDIQNNWGSVMSIAGKNDQWNNNAGPSLGWNDPDMLEVGNGKLTPGEDRAHFSLWCLMKAPLILGNDVRNMTAHTKSILMNREAIAVNQDLLGKQGKRIQNNRNSEVWAGPLSRGRHVLALVNKGPLPSILRVDAVQTLGLAWAKAPFTVRDIWQAKTVVNRIPTVWKTVPSHDVAFMVLTPGVPAK